MKYLKILTINLLFTYSVVGQTPFDDFIPEMKSKKILELTNVKFELENNSDNSTFSKIVFDDKKMTLKYFSKNNETKSILLKPTDFKWLTIDPKAEDYYNWSPYNYVLCNPIGNIDPFGEDVYILFYTVGNNGGDNAFSAAAQTRKEEIESMKSFNSETDKVIMFGISDISDIESLTNWAVDSYSEQFGKTAEVGMWSHAGWDGPIGTEATGKDPLYEGSPQMSMEGWSNIDFNWKEGGKMGFYGCNTGNDYYDGDYVGSFARDVSRQNNYSNVNVWGQTTSSYPSTHPHVRATTAARTMGAFWNGKTYMVGGNYGQGAQSHWFTPSC